MHFWPGRNLGPINELFKESSLMGPRFLRTGKSDDDADLDWILPIAARATSAELESSAHLLWLAGVQTVETPMAWL